MSYCSGRVEVVGVQWEVHCNVGEMRGVRCDWRCGDSIYGSGFVNGMTNRAFGNCDPFFGLRFDAARALWGLLLGMRDGEMRETLWAGETASRQIGNARHA
jgi:hypothetical protein